MDITDIYGKNKEQVEGRKNPIILPPDSYVLDHEKRIEEINQKQFRAMIDSSDDPTAEREKLLSSTFIAKELNLEPKHVYQNHDIYVQKYLDFKDIPKHSWTAIKDEWNRGWLNNKISKVGIKLMADPENQEYIKELEDLYSKMPKADKQERGIFTQFAKSTTSFLPSMVSAGKWGIGGGLLGGVGGYLVGGAPGAKTGATKGAQIGTFIGGAKNATGSIFTSIMSTENPETGEMIIKDPNAREAMYGIAIASSLSGGIISGLIEKAQIGTLLKGSITREVFESVTNQGIKNFLSKKVLQSKATQVIADYGLTIGEEVLQEVAQESIELLSEELSKAVYNYHESSNLPQATRDEWLAMIKEVAITTAQGTATLGIFKAGGQLAKKIDPKKDKGFVKGAETIDVSLDNIVSFDSTEVSREIAGEKLDQRKLYQ